MDNQQSAESKRTAEDEPMKTSTKRQKIVASRTSSGMQVDASPKQTVRTPKSVCYVCDKGGKFITCKECYEDFHPRCGGDKRTWKVVNASDEDWFCKDCKAKRTQRPQDHGSDSGLGDSLIAGSVDPIDGTGSNGSDSGLGESVLTGSLSPENGTALIGLEFADEDDICLNCDGHFNGAAGVVLVCQSCRDPLHLPCCNEDRTFDEIAEVGYWKCPPCVRYENSRIDQSIGDSGFVERLRNDESRDEESDASSVSDDEIRSQVSGDDSDAEINAGDRALDEAGDEVNTSEVIDVDEELAVLPIQKRSKPIYLTKYSVDALSILRIGDPIGELGMGDEANKQRCLQNFETIYRGLIRGSKAWAEDDTKPFDPVMRRCWKAFDVEDWWNYVKRSTSETRRLVIGAADRDWQLEDQLSLPPITGDELRQWIVYCNFSVPIEGEEEPRPYTGSATNYTSFAWDRLAKYARLFIRKERGDELDPEELNYHEKHATRLDVAIYFKALSVPSPADGRLRADCLEGLHGMRTGSFHVGYRGKHWTAEVEKAMLEALPQELKGMKQYGLNHAHQFTQECRLTDIDRVLVGDRRDLFKLRGQERLCKSCGVVRPVPDELQAIQLEWKRNPLDKSKVDDHSICAVCWKHWYSEEAVACDACGNILMGSKGLQTHKRNHCKGKKQDPAPIGQLICGTCNKTFKDKKGLDQHEKNHCKGNPKSAPTKDDENDRLICDVCNKTFKNKKHLVEHEKNRCKGNPKSAPTEDDRANKESGPSETAPIEYDEDGRPICDICKKSLNNEKALKIHKHQVHGSEPATCDMCGKVLKNKKQLQAHKRNYCKGEKRIS